MIYNKKKFRPAVTIVELTIAFVIGLIIILTVGTVLVAGHRNWLQTFNRATTGIEPDSLDAMITFGITGRQSNKRDYCIYKVTGNSFTPARPPSGINVAVVDGNAIEFRFWDVPLSATLINVNNTATAYRLFYREGDKLMMDEGTYPPGGVAGGSRRSGVRTVQLADNVSLLQFTHTSKADFKYWPGNVIAYTPGDGSIRMEMILTDPNNNNSITVKTTTLMRNVWGIN